MHDRSSSGRAHQRRKRSSGACGNLSSLRLELTAALMVSCLGVGKLSGTGVGAFLALPPRMSSNTRVHSQQQQPAEDVSLTVARKLIMHEATGSRRVTKKALLESIGYGVMDPLAYQTFENSPLPPKLRPTTHARIAEGIHSFGQEFLGVPPEDGVSLFSELAAPAVDDGRSMHDAGASPPPFELHPKIPGVGLRMTVLRLGNGELLAHSPVAPTVELLDMLRSSFPAIGPTAKVHLFSTSMSPEHWAFLKHWKEVFPSAEVWAVPGPHQRLMGVNVDHDIEQICGVPERLGGEVEVAVLEGVPMVREALLLHRPTGTLLSADLLLAMDKVASAQSLSDGVDHRHGSDPASTLSSSPLPSQPRTPKRFGEHGPSLTPIETNPALDAAKGGRLRRLRWGLLGRTASLLDMNTLSVFAPVKALLRTFKGNSAAFSSRVLSWEATKFVGSHGQSPLEGPELKTMLNNALGRYVESPRQQDEKKKLGSRLLALVPGRRDGQSTKGAPENQKFTAFELEHKDRSSAGAAYQADKSGGGGGGGVGVSGREGGASGSFASAAASASRGPSTPHQGLRPAATGAGADYGNQADNSVSASASVTSMSETEARARRYLQEKAEIAKYSKAWKAAGTMVDAVGAVKQSSPGEKKLAFSERSGASEAGQVSKKVDTGGAKGSRGQPFVVGSDARYDERPAGPVNNTEDDDPFEAPFYPFTDDGPELNGRPFK
eukprot:g12993.t1